RCYYRVVAVDADGTQSGCSDYVEMPHPFIYTRPVAEAKVGEPYSYQPKTIMSLGDLQYRLETQDREFRDKEVYTFSLLAGPEWLHIDPETGALSGTPSPSDVGTAEVKLSAANQFEDSTTHAYRLTVRER
ncbi:MAG: putative Ig domain-containing protein, partial [Armatimonadota bacterium]